MTNVKKDCDCSKSFAEILTNLMKERETTQKELAEHIGITRQAISQYTKGITQPTADIIVRIAKFFNVSTDYLLGVVSEKSADMDIQGACKFFGVSEKTVQGINNFISAVLDFPCSEEEKIEHLKILELLVNSRPIAAAEIIDTLLKLREVNGRNKFLSSSAYRKHLDKGYHYWYFYDDEDTEYLMYKISKKLKKCCDDVLNCCEDLITDEELVNLEKAETLLEIKEMLNCKYTRINTKIADFIDLTIEQQKDLIKNT